MGNFYNDLTIIYPLRSLKLCYYIRMHGTPYVSYNMVVIIHPKGVFIHNRAMKIEAAFLTNITWRNNEK